MFKERMVKVAKTFPFPTLAPDPNNFMWEFLQGACAEVRNSFVELVLSLHLYVGSGV